MLQRFGHFSHELALNSSCHLGSGAGRKEAFSCCLTRWMLEDNHDKELICSGRQDFGSVHSSAVFCKTTFPVRADAASPAALLVLACGAFGNNQIISAPCRSQVLEGVLHSLDQDGTMSVEDFFYGLLRNGKPLTPSASTPYRQLKRHLSMQVRGRGSPCHAQLPRGCWDGDGAGGVLLGKGRDGPFEVMGFGAPCRTWWALKGCKLCTGGKDVA